MAMNEQGKR